MTDEEFNLFEDDENEEQEEQEASQSSDDFVSKTEYDRMQSELEQAKKDSASALQFKQDMQNYFNPNQGPEADPLIQKLAKDPKEFVQDIKNQTLEEVRQQNEAQDLRREYREKHPDLVDMETYIFADAQKIWAENQQQGVNEDTRTILDKAVKRFRETVGHKQNVDNRIRDVKRQSFNLTTSNGSDGSKKDPVAAIWAMDEGAFERKKQSILRRDIVTD